MPAWLLSDSMTVLASAMLKLLLIAAYGLFQCSEQGKSGNGFHESAR
jgi:hypothetical protein